ncbi:MAG: hypothetical protein UY50_C0038G0010 [Parcubacteria group bacterium GW2011_GWA2_49_9]|nr:MAG: hypothetical protein UY50_C0038G0010 [Parcubacteria group bacterium GW2011_GWA2_49_9]
MEGEEKIAEDPRGIAYKQNLDPYMTPILEAKLKEFGPAGETYKQKSADMKLLTAIEGKTKAREPLTKSDLVFLYELEHPIQGFGYRSDPRVAELRTGRNKEEDMSIVFDCRPDQIAHGVSEINENTRAYLGEWNPAILKTVKNYPNITHLYESFPDKAIFLKTIETDPTIQSPKQAEAKLKEQSICLSQYGNDLLNKTEFSKQKETYKLARFTVEQLGFPDGATTEQIYKKAETLGLDLCPAEVGPHLRLSYEGGEWMLIAMKQITDRDGNPSVFYLNRDGVALKLGGNFAWPVRGWSAGDQFVFLLRKKKL